MPTERDRADRRKAYHKARKLGRPWAFRNRQTPEQRKATRQRRGAEKERASTLVYDARMRGSIKKPPRCSRCGAVCDVQAHHEDYSKPLEVVWLCPPCHGFVHRLARAEDV